MSSETVITDLRSRVAKLERESTGGGAQTLQEQVLDKVLEALAENAEDYIPKIGALQSEIRKLRIQLETDVKNLKQTGEISKGESEQSQRLEFDNLRRTVATLDHSLTDKFNVLQKENDDNASKLFTTITNHPVHSRVDTLESRLPNYITKDRFNAIQESMLEMASTSAVEHIIQELACLPDKFLTKYEYSLNQDQFLKDLDVKLDLRVSFERLNQELDTFDQDVQDRIDQVIKSIEGPRKQIKKMKLEFVKVIDVANNQTELLKKKVDFDEIQRIWKNFDKCAMYEDLKDLYMKTVPEIYKFEQRIEEHRHDLVKQNEILTRFDEVMSDKVNRLNLTQVVIEASKKYALIDDFQKTKKDSNDQMTKNTKNIALLQDSMDILAKQITKDIFSAVKKATSHLQKKSPFMKGPGADMVGGAKIGGSDNEMVTEEIKALVNSKADHQQILNLTAQKANKIDTQLSMRWIEIINRQLKQIVVLITEMLRFEVDKKQMKMFEGEQHIQHNKGFLFQQALMISQWINKFSTQQVNEYFLESSNGVTELNWTPPDVVAFQVYAEEKLRDVDMEVLITRNAALAQNLKMRSKSLLQGGTTNLATAARATGGHHSKQQSPRGGKPKGGYSRVLSPNEAASPAMILNNKIHYANNDIKVTLNGGASSSIDQQQDSLYQEDMIRKSRATTGMRILNNDSHSLVFTSPSPQSMLRYPSGGAAGETEEKPKVEWKNLASQNRQMFNKTLMIGARGGSNLAFTSNGIGIAAAAEVKTQIVIQGSDRHLNKDSQVQGLFKTLRNSTNFPGISKQPPSTAI